MNLQQILDAAQQDPALLEELQRRLRSDQRLQGRAAEGPAREAIMERIAQETYQDLTDDGSVGTQRLHNNATADINGPTLSRMARDKMGFWEGLKLGFTKEGLGQMAWRGVTGQGLPETMKQEIPSTFWGEVGREVGSFVEPGSLLTMALTGGLAGAGVKVAGKGVLTSAARRGAAKAGVKAAMRKKALQTGLEPSRKLLTAAQRRAAQRGGISSALRKELYEGGPLWRRAAASGATGAGTLAGYSAAGSVAQQGAAGEGVSWQQVFKDAMHGGAMGAVALGPAGAIPPLNPSIFLKAGASKTVANRMAKLGTTAAKFTAESLAFGSFEPALEGRLPTSMELAKSFAFLGTLKAAFKLPALPKAAMEGLAHHPSVRTPKQKAALTEAEKAGILKQWQEGAKVVAPLMAQGEVPQYMASRVGQAIDAIPFKKPKPAIQFLRQIEKGQQIKKTELEPLRQILEELGNQELTKDDVRRLHDLSAHEIKVETRHQGEQVDIEAREEAESHLNEAKERMDNAEYVNQNPYEHVDLDYIQETIDRHIAGDIHDYAANRADAIMRHATQGVQQDLFAGREITRAEARNQLIDRYTRRIEDSENFENIRERLEEKYREQVEEAEIESVREQAWEDYTEARGDVEYWTEQMAETEYAENLEYSEYSYIDEFEHAESYRELLPYVESTAFEGQAPLSLISEALKHFGVTEEQLKAADRADIPRAAYAELAAEHSPALAQAIARREMYRQQPYVSQHYNNMNDPKNLLGHIRVSDAMDGEGKSGVFAWELQTDWTIGENRKLRQRIKHWEDQGLSREDAVQRVKDEGGVMKDPLKPPVPEEILREMERADKALDAKMEEVQKELASDPEFIEDGGWTPELMTTLNSGQALGALRTIKSNIEHYEAMMREAKTHEEAAVARASKPPYYERRNRYMKIIKDYEAVMQEQTDATAAKMLYESKEPAYPLGDAWLEHLVNQTVAEGVRSGAKRIYWPRGETIAAKWGGRGKISEIKYDMENERLEIPSGPHGLQTEPIGSVIDNVTKAKLPEVMWDLVRNITANMDRPRLRQETKEIAERLIKDAESKGLENREGYYADKGPKGVGHAVYTQGGEYLYLFEQMAEAEAKATALNAEKPTRLGHIRLDDPVTISGIWQKKIYDDRMNKMFGRLAKKHGGESGNTIIGDFTSDLGVQKQTDGTWRAWERNTAQVDVPLGEPSADRAGAEFTLAKHIGNEEPFKNLVNFADLTDGLKQHAREKGMALYELPPGAREQLRRVMVEGESTRLENRDQAVGVIKDRMKVSKAKAESLADVLDFHANAYTEMVGLDKADYYRSIRIGEGKSREARGAFDVLEDGQRVIYALNNPDVRVGIHEFGHLFMNDLLRGSKLNEDLAKDLKTLEDYVRVEGGNWSIEAHERVNTIFEKYMAEGRAPVPELQPLFTRFKKWLGHLFQKVTGMEHVPVDPELRSVFHRFFDSTGGKADLEIMADKKGANPFNLGMEDVRKWSVTQKQQAAIAALEARNIEELWSRDARGKRKNRGKSFPDDFAFLVEEKAPEGKNLGEIELRLTKGFGSKARLDEALGRARKILDVLRDDANKKVEEGIPKNKRGDGPWIARVERYLPHVWRKVSRGIENLQNPRWQTEGSFLRKRKLPTLAEGIELGLEPVSLNVPDLIRYYGNMTGRIGANKMLVFDMHRHKVGNEKGELGPVIMRVHKAPSGWKKLTHPALSHYWARQKGDKVYIYKDQQAAVHPDYYQAIRMALEEPSQKGFLKNAANVAAIAKRAELYFSFFHHIALTESALATLGLKGLFTNKIEQDPHTGKWVKTSGRMATKNVGKLLMSDVNYLKHLIEWGVDLGGTPDVGVRQFAEMWASLEAKTRNVPGLHALARRAQDFNKAWDRGLWDHYHAALKAAAFFEAEADFAKRKPNATAAEWAKKRRETASFVNDAFGGQNWSLMAKQVTLPERLGPLKLPPRLAGRNVTLSAHPKMRQALQVIMLAPDWTFSNMRIAGKAVNALKGGRRGGKFAFDNPELARLYLRYWRNMMATVLMGGTAVQALSYLIAGDDDKGDKMWIWDNEHDRKTDMDVTPLMRALGLVPEGERRYSHLGKQAREVLGWVTNPIKVFHGKMSPVAHMAMEQLTGSQGFGFETEYSRMKFWESLPARGKGIASKFVPFSFRGNQFALSVPLKKGATPWKVQVALQKALRGYAHPKFKQSPFASNMEPLVADIVDAAQRNGLNGETMFREALSRTRGEFYGKFFEALEKQDQEEMDRWAEVIVRLHGGLKGLLRSVETRKRRRASSTSDREVQLATTSYRRATRSQGRTAQDRALLNELTRGP